jgi:hypothetical protein
MRSQMTRYARRVLQVLGRRAEPEPPDYFINYGPDWPPAPKRPAARPARGRRLLRSCVRAVVMYAVIWCLGVVVLELRTYEQRAHPGVSVTTYTTVTAGR